MLMHYYYYCHYHFCTCVVLGSFPPLCLSAVSLNLSSITYVNISIRSHGKDCKIYIKEMHCWFLRSLSGHIKSFTTVSVFPIRMFFSCFAGFIVSSRYGEPFLTSPSPSLFSFHRYNLPVGRRGGSCMIEIVADNGPARRLQEYVSRPAPEVMWPACNQLNLLSNNYEKWASRAALSASPKLKCYSAISRWTPWPRQSGYKQSEKLLRHSPSS